MIRKIVLLAIICLLAWKGYEHYELRRDTSYGARSIDDAKATALPSVPTAPSASFSCDNRKYCSQMTSCLEATYFLKNCPGVKMDGNNDGVPCEQQWCR